MVAPEPGLVSNNKSLNLHAFRRRTYLLIGLILGYQVTWLGLVSHICLDCLRYMFSASKYSFNLYPELLNQSRRLRNGGANSPKDWITCWTTEMKTVRNSNVKSLWFTWNFIQYLDVTTPWVIVVFYSQTREIKRNSVPKFPVWDILKSFPVI